MRRALAAALLSIAAAVSMALLAGSVGAPRPALAETQPQPPNHGRTPEPYTPPPELEFTLPPDPTQAPPPPRQQVVVTPAPPPTETPLPTTAPVPTGPAVGAEVTPQGAVSVPVSGIGPTPQGNGSDVTTIVVIVIVGLVLLAIGAFVLAISV